MSEYNNRRFCNKEDLEAFFLEEAELMEYTDEMKYVLNDYNKFKQMFYMLQSKDIRSLGKIIMQLYHDLAEIKKRLNKLQRSLDDTKREKDRLWEDNKVLRRELMMIKAARNYKELQENMEIERLYRNGYSCRQIADQINRDKSTVSRRLKRMGIIKEK